MGRAQVVQAEAAGIDPDVRMNPVLLKPTSDRKSQVVFMGKVLKDMDAVDYHEFKQELLPKIKEMLEGGMTQREVAERLGVTGERAIHHLLTRERKKELHGIPKQRGRKPAKALAEYKYENKRLKMEVELLRDFLLLTGKE